RGVYVLGPGLPDAPLDGAHQRARLPGDEGPGTAMDGHVEVEARAQDVRAHKPVLTRLLQGQPRVLDGQWVLLPYVDIPLVGTDGVAADDQTFEDAVGVTLEEATVHVRAGVPLVAVDDDVLHIARRLAGRLPLHAGRESAAPPPAQVGPLDPVDDLLWAQLEERLGQGRVAADGDVVIDPFRINE